MTSAVTGYEASLYQSGDAVMLSSSKRGWRQSTPSALVSSILDKMSSISAVVVMPEATALDRTQQKSFMKALRRSVKIVA